MKQVPSGSKLHVSIINAPTGLTGTIGFRILDDDGVQVRAKQTSGIAESPAGSGHYSGESSTPLVLPLGEYEALWDSDPGGVVTPDNSASQAFEIVPGVNVSVGPVTPSLDPAMCDLWVTADDVLAAAPAGTTIDAAALAAQQASSILFELSGEQFPGICTDTVVPWWPNSWCAGGARPYPNLGPWAAGVSLPGHPAISVDEVRANGVIVDPQTYWLSGQLLVNAPIGLGVEIDYTFGQPPPLAGHAAALAFAVELVAAASGGECKLPARVTQITRAGVTANLSKVDMKKIGQTGISDVDVFLAAYNPSGATRPPQIWSPDMIVPRRM